MEVIVSLAAVAFLFLLLRAFSTRGEGAPASGAVPPTDDAIREMLLRGRRIEAIKAYRSLHRVGLKEAREAVEQLARTLPPAS